MMIKILVKIFRWWEKVIIEISVIIVEELGFE